MTASQLHRPRFSWLLSSRGLCWTGLLLGLGALTLTIPGDLQGRGFGARGGYSARAGSYSAGYSRSGAVAGPYGGGGYAHRSGSTVVGPAGGTARAGTASGSYTTQRGTNISYGAAGRGATGPGGYSAGRAVGGVQVTTPGGRSYTDVGRAGGVSGPGGVRVGGRSGATVASGPGGTVASTYRGGVAVGPYGAAGASTRRGVAIGPGGVTAGTTRSGAAVGVGGATARYGTYYASRSTLAMQGANVRRGFTYHNAFTPRWYGRYPGAWYAAGWASGYAWRAATWPTLSTYCGWFGTPIYYDYGSSVVYQGNQVYIDGEPTVTVDQYAAQASTIASVGREATPAKTEDWQPLGVFALIQGDEKTSYKIFQLAINKKGVLRGNYYDALADNTLPVYGSVDAKSQRAAWSIGEKKDIVFEAGIANLTRDQTSCLVHFGKDNTQQFTLVRIEEKKEDGLPQVIGMLGR